MTRYLMYASERYALGIMRPLQAAIRARGDEAAWFFDGPGVDELTPGERVLGSVDEVMDFSPAAVFAPGNHVPGFFPGVKVAVFHGFDAGKPKHVYVRGFYDLYCTTGPGDTAAFERLAESLGYFSVKETGWPKLDPYAGFASLPAGDKPVVLYHSTFSPSWSAAAVLFEQVRRLSATGRWHWIVCLHPKTNAETVARYRSLVSENLEFSEDDNILDVFPRADVMVSDTSSALSEFLLWQKPVVTFKNRRPGPELIDIDEPSELEGSIENALGRPVELMTAVKKYTDAIHPARDGRASERVLAAVDEFIATGSAELRKKPLNLWRNWRVGRRLARLG